MSVPFFGIFVLFMQSDRKQKGKPEEGSKQNGTGLAFGLSNRSFFRMPLQQDPRDGRKGSGLLIQPGARRLDMLTAVLLFFSVWFFPLFLLCFGLVLCPTFCCLSCKITLVIWLGVSVSLLLRAHKVHRHVCRRIHSGEQTNRCGRPVSSQTILGSSWSILLA